VEMSEVKHRGRMAGSHFCLLGIRATSKRWTRSRKTERYPPNGSSIPLSGISIILGGVRAINDAFAFILPANAYHHVGKELDQLVTYVLLSVKAPLIGNVNNFSLHFTLVRAIGIIVPVHQ